MGHVRTGSLCAAALVVAVTALPAHAGPSLAIASAMDRFQSACALALTDPDAYIASLTLPGPSGEPGIYPSEDGQYVLVLTAQSEGLTDHVEFVGTADRLIRRCAISAIIPGYPEEPEIAAALRPVLKQRATEVVGGRTESFDPIWEPGNAAMVFEGEPFHMFYASGLFPGLDVVASVQTQMGEVYLSVDHSVFASEAAQ